MGNEAARSISCSVCLAVMGFGLGSPIFAPLLESMLGKDPAQLAATLPRTFMILSAIFFVVFDRAQLLM